MLEDNTPLSKTLFYLHSMDTWVHSVMMKAERERDRNRILTLGAFSIVVERAIQMTENHR